MSNRDGLTPQQQTFVETYLANGRNAAAAYRAAYPGNAKPEVVWVQASKMLHHPKVALRIAEADAKVSARLERVMHREAITKQAIAERLARIAFGKGEELGQDVPLPEQRKALESLARLMGYVVEKREVRKITSIRDLSDEELEAVITEGQREQGDDDTRH